MAITKAKAEIESLAASGIEIELVNVGVQPYAHVHNVGAPDALWDRTGYDILIPVPLAYDEGTGLDGFYLKLPYVYRNGLHNRVSGDEIAFAGATWKRVSWHYPDNKLFRPKVDSVESHIIHCKGFFWERGAINARV